VRLDYSCHHFAQAGDVDLQIKPEVHYKPELLIISVTFRVVLIRKALLLLVYMP